MISTRLFRFLLVFELLAAGCTLNMSPATPTLPPTLPPAPLVLPQMTEGVAPPLTSINPNCPTTPFGWVEYTVEPGDSLGLLAQQTESTIEIIMTGNCLDNADQLFVGQVIYLPRVPVITSP